MQVSIHPESRRDSQAILDRICESIAWQTLLEYGRIVNQADIARRRTFYPRVTPYGLLRHAYPSQVDYGRNAQELSTILSNLSLQRRPQGGSHRREI